MKLKLLVQIMDENGDVLAEHISDPCQPSRWIPGPGQKITGDMLQNSSDVINNGTYELFGLTIQPHLKVDRPNGWSAPPPSTGIQLPANFPTTKSYPFNKNPAPWSMSAPTNPTQYLTGPAPQRG